MALMVSSALTSPPRCGAPTQQPWTRRVARPCGDDTTNQATRALAARSVVRRRCSPRRLCAQRAAVGGGDKQAHQPPPSPAVLLVCSAGVAAALLLGTPAATASGGERRHQRGSRVRDELAARGKVLPQRPVTFADGRLTIEAGDMLADTVQGVNDGVQRTLRDVKSALKRPPRRLRGSDWASSNTVTVVTSRDGTPALQMLPSGGSRASQASRTVGSVLLAAGILFVFFAVLRPSRRAAHAAGTWVRDRSLGGRLVQVADSERPGAGGRPASVTNPLAADTDGAAKTSQGASRSWDAAAEEEAAPLWWVPPPAAAVVSAARKAASESDAKAAVGRLNSARVGGRPYEVADYLQLRAACARGGISVDVTAGDTARDALYRGAVEAALTGAAEGPSALAGLTPGALLSGLASDMRLPLRRAGTLVAAATAARVRGSLLDALAQQRRGQAMEVTMQMAALGALLRELPLAPGAPELELVATGLAGSTTAEERVALLALHRQANGSDDPTCLLVAEALGVAEP